MNRCIGLASQALTTAGPSPYYCGRPTIHREGALRRPVMDAQTLWGTEDSAWLTAISLHPRHCAVEEVGSFFGQGAR